MTSLIKTACNSLVLIEFDQAHLTQSMSTWKHQRFSSLLGAWRARILFSLRGFFSSVETNTPDLDPSRYMVIPLHPASHPASYTFFTVSTSISAGRLVVLEIAWQTHFCAADWIKIFSYEGDFIYGVLW